MWKPLNLPFQFKLLLLLVRLLLSLGDLVQGLLDQGPANDMTCFLAPIKILLLA